jgi:hypothetical protein
MRAIRARFSAYEEAVIEGRIQLRPLTSPLYRYADVKNGIVDGAIFSFANGTNPEVFLLLEAHDVDGAMTWLYGLAQMTGGAVTATLDGRDAWKCAAADPPAIRESYFNGWLAPDSAPP